MFDPQHLRLLVSPEAPVCQTPAGKGFRHLDYFGGLLLWWDSSPVIKTGPAVGVEWGGEVQDGALEDGVSPGGEEMGCWLLPQGITTFSSS